MDTMPEDKQDYDSAELAALSNSGYTCSRLGLVPCPREDHRPYPESFQPSPAPAPVRPSVPRPQSPLASPPSQPADWRPSHPAQMPAPSAPTAATPPKPADEEFVRVTVKVPRALRDILRSCAKNTHQYQYVLVIEALAEFLVHLPEDVQRQLLRDINGETPTHLRAGDVPTSTWKRFWKRWLNRHNAGKNTP